MRVTNDLVKWVINTKYEDISKNVIYEAKRSLFNWLGVAIGACYHPSVEMVLSLADEVGGREQASILGRKEKLNVLFASLINGMTSHIFDFDDTNIEIVLHPSSPVAPVVFALGELYNLKGEDILTAFILGVEAETRISQAVYPDHYNVGWHITATAGNFGAAVAAGKILGLDEKKFCYAMGIAATQASGLREMFGTMTKAFHPGKSAMNGVMAAMLAEKGFTSSLQGIEAKMGFANVLSTKQDYFRITDKLGENWELLQNAYKPFACGTVAHPTIDGVLRIKSKYDTLNIQNIVEIKSHVNKLVPILMGKKEPKIGLESKFSIYHCAAVALLDGMAGERQFSDDRVLQEDVISLRNKVKLLVKENIREDEAFIEVTLNDGTILKEHINHAIGSINNPMNDEDLQKKFAEVTNSILTEEEINNITNLIYNLEKVQTIKKIIDECTG